MSKNIVFKLFNTSLLAMLLTLLFFILPTAKASASPLVGAIRWDGWVGDTVTSDGPYVGQQVERSLGPNKYHFRLPFFGVETGTNSVQARELTQTVMDQDIAYAKNAGINYWAFDYYPNGNGLDTAKDLYDSSMHKSDVKYCFIGSQGGLPSSDFSLLVSKFGESNYQKVLTNRPIFYIFGTPYSASEITTLRNLTTAAGLGTPYIVMMNTNSSSAASAATSMGADAISSYVTTASGGGPYSGLAAADVTNWQKHENTGKKVVPWVTTGWDPRPRIDNPVAWTTYSSNSWVQTATPAQIASHLQEGVNWVNNNTSVADANTVIMYAWNEYDEGGWISPTLYTGTDRLDAIKAVLLPTPTPTPPPGGNLALSHTYSASSQWDSTQTAASAFDGSQTTDWQAASGSTFNGQWLQVDFGTNKTFNNVVLSEYGNRTTGYRIEYWNGSSWITAYSGTSIGTSSTANFSAVTGSKARIYFTSGAPGATPVIYEFQIYNLGSTDTTAPSTVSSFAVSTTTGNSAILNWTAPGDDGSTGIAASYDIRYSTSTITTGNWASATQVTGEPIPALAGTSQSFTVTGLSASTTYYFAIKTSDEIPNVSGLSNIPSGATTSATSNLALNNTYSASSQYNISQTASKAFDGSTGTNWQAAATFIGEWLQVDFGVNTTFNKAIITEYGNRTSGYRIEYWNGSSWQTAYTGTTIGDIGTPKTVTFTSVTGSKARIYFTSGTSTPIIYEFEIYNQGVSDSTAPSAVTNLSASSPTSSTQTLNWSSPGDDGIAGTATSYDIRYSTSVITDSNWANATQATGEPTPSTAGTSQSFTVTGLSSSTTYYFAIKTSDEVPNVSGLSNVPSGITASGGSGGNLASNHTYSDSSEWDASQAAAKAFDGIQGTNWQAASGTTFNGQWLQVDFGTNTTFNKVELSEYGGRTAGYLIEYWNGSSWSTAYTGTTIGASRTVTFTAVTGSKARVYFTSGTLTPIIYEFEIYNEGVSSNLLTNSGFESGTTGWSAQAASISSDTTNVHSGTKAIKISSRSANYGAATQDIKSIVLTNGQGNYSISSWAKFATGTDNVHLVIQIVDDSGTHWYEDTATSVGTSYTQLSFTFNVTWSGTLTSAILYTQSSSSTSDMYEDDFSMTK